MRIIKQFYKEDSGQWYIDLPEYIEAGGSKEDLQMVMGADTMLDILSQGESDIYLDIISTDKYKGPQPLYTLTLDREEKPGEDYEPWGIYSAKGNLWNVDIPIVGLCPVTKYVFNGEYPKEIFIRK